MEQLVQGGDLKPSASVRKAESQDGAVLLDVRQGLCFSMNPVAALIWEQLGQGCSPMDIAHNLTKTFDISVEQASVDVQQFVHQLSQLQLLRPPKEAQLLVTRTGKLRAFLRRLRNPSQHNGTKAK
jgi:hypothetical protein